MVPTPVPMRSLSVIVIAVWAVVLCFGALLFVGSAQVSFSDVWHTLTGQMPASSVEAYIVIHVRLPLALTALLAGMALAASGLLMQTLMENPLADASLMGVHAGASADRCGCRQCRSVRHCRTWGSRAIVLIMVSFGSCLSDLPLTSDLSCLTTSIFQRTTFRFESQGV